MSLMFNAYCDLKIAVLQKHLNDKHGKKAAPHVTKIVPVFEEKADVLTVYYEVDHGAKMFTMQFKLRGEKLAVVKDSV